jgi:hypothetical protein
LQVLLVVLALGTGLAQEGERQQARGLDDESIQSQVFSGRHLQLRPQFSGFFQRKKGNIPPVDAET